MALRPDFAWFDGKVVPFAEAKLPIDDRGLLFAESLYEVMPITGGQPRLIEEHAERMRRAAPELDLEAGVPSVDEWRHLSAELLLKTPTREALLYAQLTGGTAPREHVPEVRPPPTFFAYLSAYRFPRGPEVERGVRAITLEDLRWGRCDLKTTMLLPAVLAKKEARRRGAQEALLVGKDGCVREGASSNVFVVEAGTLVTPGQSPRLLPGTMRPLVFDVADELGILTRSEDLPVARLRGADEVFVTSSSQLVMPIVALDGALVGSGGAGPVARDLARGLRARLEISD